MALTLTSPACGFNENGKAQFYFYDFQNEWLEQDMNSKKTRRLKMRYKNETNNLVGTKRVQKNGSKKELNGSK